MAKSLKRQPMNWKELAAALSLALVMFVVGIWFAQEFCPPVNPWANRTWQYSDYEAPLGFLRTASVEAPSEPAARETIKRSGFKIRDQGQCVPALTGRAHVLAGELSQ